MELDLDSIQISDLALDVHWNLHLLHSLFGEHMNAFVLNQGSIDYESANHWGCTLILVAIEYHPWCTLI